MRHIALATAISLVLTAPAFATANDATVFPPQNCAVGSLSLISTTQTANGVFTSTQCLTPLQVLSQAWPCIDGQTLLKNPDGSVACQDISASSKLTLSCPTGQVLTGITNGTPVCTTAVTTAGGAGTVALASCRLDLYGHAAYPSGISSDYIHIQPNGADPTDTLSQWQWLYTYHGGENFVSTQMMPTGWQDNPSTCENDYMSANFQTAGQYCYTCVNGTWSQYSFTPNPYVAPVQPGPGG